MKTRIRFGRAWLWGALVAAAVVGVIGTTLFRDGAPRQVAHEPDTPRLGREPTHSVADRPQPNMDVPGPSRSSLAALTPTEVIGNPDCIMRPGAGHGRDVAVVLVSGDDGSRFAVVDGSGVVFGDTLPFRAVRDWSHARRKDGSVLAGFGGSTVRGERWLRDHAAPFGPAVQGVVVYQDGQIIYRNGEASRFGLAADGSSFYAVEPLAGGVYRLVIRNLDLGVETHHDLGNLQTANDGNAFVVQYSLDQSEVVIQPFDFFGGDRSRQFDFYPTNGNEPRRLSTDVRGFPNFVSSNEGYFALPRRDGVDTVSREFRYDDEGVTVAERWSRNLGMGRVSDDGAWVVGRNATGVHVLDASTGETVFVHPWSIPIDYTSRIHDGRLVLGHGVGEPEDIARCRDKRNVANRIQENEPDGASTVRFLVDVTDEKACFADLRERGLYRTVYDVYDLRTLADGTPPDHYQVEYGENPHCGSGDDPFGTLEVRDDRLVYVPRT